MALHSIVPLLIRAMWIRFCLLFIIQYLKFHCNRWKTRVKHDLLTKSFLKERNGYTFFFPPSKECCCCARYLRTLQISKHNVQTCAMHALPLCQGVGSPDQKHGVTNRRCRFYWRPGISQGVESRYKTGQQVDMIPGFNEWRRQICFLLSQQKKTATTNCLTDLKSHPKHVHS